MQDRAPDRMPVREAASRPAPDTSRLPPAAIARAQTSKGAADEADPAAPPGIARATNGVWMVRIARVTPVTASAAPRSVPVSGESVCPSERDEAVGSIGRSVGPAASWGP